MARIKDYDEDLSAPKLLRERARDSKLLGVALMMLLWPIVFIYALQYLYMPFMMG